MISTSEQETYDVREGIGVTSNSRRIFFCTAISGPARHYSRKGLADGFGVEDMDEVSSPTFTLINQYAGRVKVYHIDLYRIETGALEGLGLEEIFDDPGGGSDHRMGGTPGHIRNARRGEGISLIRR